MSFAMEIEPEWNVIKKIKESINQDPRIIELGTDFRDAALLTAIELVENALKYSEGESDLPVSISLELDDILCEIKVTNICNNADHRAALQLVLIQLQEQNPFDLYVQRLEQLKDHPDGFSRMGMIRIVYEAEFELQTVIQDNQVTMVASREI